MNYNMHKTTSISTVKNMYLCGAIVISLLLLANSSADGLLVIRGII